MVRRSRCMGSELYDSVSGTIALSHLAAKSEASRQQWRMLAIHGECKVWTSVSGSQHAITANLDVSFRPLISIHAITANLDVSFRPLISIHAITANLDVSFRPLYALPLRGFKFQAESLYRR